MTLRQAEREVVAARRRVRKAQRGYKVLALFRLRDAVSLALRLSAAPRQMELPLG